MCVRYLIVTEKRSLRDVVCFGADDGRLELKQLYVIVALGIKIFM